jgi:acetyltransferase-like isoleucine patch superfamily enzyme
VWIGDDVYLENDYPECVEIQDGAVLSVRSIVIAHTQGAGKVVIGKNAFIGAGSVIVTSGNRPLVIGEGAVIMASSLVNGSVAPYTLYGSDHSRPLARLSKAFTPDMSYEELISTIRPLSD